MHALQVTDVKFRLDIRFVVQKIIFGALVNQCDLLLILLSVLF
jgi:hypothetical protein